MRRFNQAIIFTLLGVLAVLLWWSLEDFEQQDRAAKKMFDTAMYHWGNADWQGTGDFARAEMVFRRLLEEYPESQWSVQAAPYLVSTLMNQRNDTAALAMAEYYAERYRGSESEARLWFQQGQCLQRLGRPQAAAAAWRVYEERLAATRPENTAGQDSPAGVLTPASTANDPGWSAPYDTGGGAH